MTKNWVLRVGHAAPVNFTQWANSLGIRELTASLLWARGLSGIDEMDVYLSPGLRHLMAPSLLPGMDAAVKTIAACLDRGGRVAVWGDYDVDGVTSTALLLDFFRLKGLEATAYLPKRSAEGYGLNCAGIERLAEQGIDLIITVDCGIASHEEAQRAAELGVALVVTDHHLPPSTLPPATAICNPKLGENAGTDLAGVGVAFFLAAGLNNALPGERIDVRRFLDFVALGTIADVVPLTGQNRILVKNGMLLLAEAKRPGIHALKEVAGIAPAAAMGAGQVGFGLAPRINAAGRMDTADEALALLLARDLDEARPLAALLDDLNSQRKSEEDRILEEAKEQAAQQPHRLGLVLCGKNWHAGIIGIVASRVVEAEYKPVVMLTYENGILKGSGRSIREFDLYAALDQLSPVLTKFGGHKLAAGLSLDTNNFEALREGFHEQARLQLGESRLYPTLRVDGELSFRDIDLGLLKEIELMQPFGLGNPEPVFTTPEVSVRSYKIFGKNHVSMQLRDEAASQTLRAKAWRQADVLGPSLAGQQIKTAFTPRLETYNGITSIELLIKDVEPVAAPGTKMRSTP
ncbi:single-stranded-DNA-specific exonuclease RecJ [Desulfovibrio inopinatus]|uniref:single-stranded-DNA-specific exonuclease RecJ n=1 Tax=Desulfovibrio inopinatus TaxID=102109 RepID=UPI0004029940|nr:single-stranded-DNA-specific exonuclease RecJ [Desulfovibrio inopinatus]